MQKITKHSRCSGCHACYNACPKNCISMQADKEGFLHPIINESECVNCGKCRKVCPINNEYNGNVVGKAYACINNNEQIREKSSSGGVFTLIAEHIISFGGVVFGAAFDEKLYIQHICVDNKDDLYKLRGSKYLQSRIDDTYKKVKHYLSKGRIVLFTGTPCQISGLKAYLGSDDKNLYLQDIICHGVPSPMVWQEYLKFQCVAFGSEFDKESLPSFRSKEEGWKRFSVSLRFTGDTEYRTTLDKDLYMKAFLSNLCLRPSCYQCHSKSLERQSDITLADFWGIENIAPDMFDDKGTSLVLVNSEKGKQLFEKVSDKMTIKQIDVNEAVKYNPSAEKSVHMPKQRQYFMNRVNSEVFEHVVSKCIKKGLFMRKAKSAIKRIIKKIMGYK